MSQPIIIADGQIVICENCAGCDMHNPDVETCWCCPADMDKDTLRRLILNADFAVGLEHKILALLN